MASFFPERHDPHFKLSNSVSAHIWSACGLLCFVPAYFFLWCTTMIIIDLQIVHTIIRHFKGIILPRTPCSLFNSITRIKLRIHFAHPYLYVILPSFHDDKCIYFKPLQFCIICLKRQLISEMKEPDDGTRTYNYGPYLKASSSASVRIISGGAPWPPPLSPSMNQTFHYMLTLLSCAECVYTMGKWWGIGNLMRDG